MTILRAQPEDHQVLTEIAHAAKRHWGYPESWIEEWRYFLTVLPEDIANNHGFIGVVDGRLIGFSGLELDGAKAILHHLWVRPEWIGKGVGRNLFEYTENFARANGATRLRLESDRHAEGFYVRMGAVVFERRPASVGGVAYLRPMMEKKLSGDGVAAS
jgi:GNAT superfamily N-acetyltransferase